MWGYDQSNCRSRKQDIPVSSCNMPVICHGIGGEDVPAKMARLSKIQSLDLDHLWHDGLMRESCLMAAGCCQARLVRLWLVWGTVSRSTVVNTNIAWQLWWPCTNAECQWWHTYTLYISLLTARVLGLGLPCRPCSGPWQLIMGDARNLNNFWGRIWGRIVG